MVPRNVVSEAVGQIIFIHAFHISIVRTYSFRHWNVTLIRRDGHRMAKCETLLIIDAIYDGELSEIVFKILIYIPAILRCCSCQTKSISNLPHTYHTKFWKHIHFETETQILKLLAQWYPLHEIHLIALNSQTIWFPEFSSLRHAKCLRQETHGFWHRKQKPFLRNVH